MGITGLLPFLKKTSRESNIKDFKGCTVAIDSYCWLHKGAFACADKLALGEKTEQYVYYCMKYVNNLLSFGLKPIMVFDGARLPSKEGVERERRERRETFRKKAAQLLREGRRGEARECLQRCIDVTPTMALELMNACRVKGVDCIVAPYEADSQLAYLSKTGIAQIIISEDSDLILFGCKKVMYKMDFQGNGVLVELENLPHAMDLRADVFTFDKFRYMCILSGCDYLPSLPGIGLGKANKVFKLTRQTDINLVLRKLPTTLKMPQLVVTKEYMEGFTRANNTFLYQLCYDPRSRKQVPLTPYPDTVDPRELEYAGPYMSKERSLQMALGNLNHYNWKTIGDFNPDTSQTVRRGGLGTPSHLLSIWDPHYRPMKLTATPGGATPGSQTPLVSTHGREVIITSNLPSRTCTQPTPKRPREPEDPNALLNLAELYDDGAIDQDAKRERCEWDVEDGDDWDIRSVPDEPTPPAYPLQEINSNCTAESPTNTHHTSHIPEPDLQPKPEPPSPKVFKNKFACQRMSTKKARFDLNAGRPDVKSRFFTEHSTPLPKTNFFHSLSETFYDVIEQKAETSETEVRLKVEVRDVGSESRTEETSHTKTETSQECDRLGAGCDDAGGPGTCPRGTPGSIACVKRTVRGNRSLHGSFGFGNKLQMFKSVFDKSAVMRYVNSSTGISPLARSQFKPVSTPGRNKENDRGTGLGVSMGGGGEVGSSLTQHTPTTTIASPDSQDHKVSDSFPTSATNAKMERQTLPQLPTLPSPGCSSTPLTPRGRGSRALGLSKSGTKSVGNETSSAKQASISSFFGQFANRKKSVSK